MELNKAKGARVGLLVEWQTGGFLHVRDAHTHPRARSK